jgi:signal transduction histidine kinase
LIWVPIFIILLVSLTACGAVRDKDDQHAVKGKLDLSEWDFRQSGSVPLGGEWTLYGHQLLTPNQLQQAWDVRYVKLPKTWNSYPQSYGFSDGLGYATYRLTVRTSLQEPILSLRVPNIFTAYRLYINGTTAASVGTVADKASDSIPEQLPRVVTFENTNGTVDLLLQVSNYNHRRGGVWANLTLGTPEDIISQQNNAISGQMILFGSLAITGLYHICLFALRREEKFTLHFGLLCLFVALRIIVTGEGFLLRWLPSLTWEGAMKIEYITFALSAWAGVMYVCRLFPKDAFVWTGRAVSFISLLLSLYVAAAPAYSFTKMLPLFQLYVVAGCMYALYVLLHAKIRKREGATFVLVGIVVFVIAIINDMLMYNEWFTTTELVPAGLFFFILMQAIIISRRFSHALRNVEDVSSELRELNSHLEDRIEERTEALRHSNEKLEQTNLELGKLATSRRHLLTNISHDLRTPMTLIQGYLEAMQDGLVNEPAQQSKYVRMMLSKIGGLNRLIRDLFELSKLEAGQVSLDLSQLSVHQWVIHIQEQYEHDIRNRDVSFQCRYDRLHAVGLPAERLLVTIDRLRMNRVLENLLFNALKHTEAGGAITISFHYDLNAGRVILGIRDTGSGITEEDLPYVFDRFYKRDKSRNSAGGGSGIGLAIVKEIIELHHGTITVESKLFEGTVFWIALPAAELAVENGVD